LTFLVVSARLAGAFFNLGAANGGRTILGVLLRSRFCTLVGLGFGLG